MELDPNLVAQNRLVREFAEKNRLRFVRLPDGELVLPLGPRKRAASPTNHLGTHASFVGHDAWVIFLITREVSATAARLRPYGCRVLERDGELIARVHENNLLVVLDASGSPLRPWRKRTPSPEQLERLRAQMAKMNG
jgi:hypothetical protein